MPDGNAGRSARRTTGGFAAGLQPRLGRVVGIDEDGRARVSFAGRIRSAPMLGSIDRAELERAAGERRVVLLGFLDGQPDTPVVLSLQDPEALEHVDAAPDEREAAEPVAVEIDGEQQVITAAHELVLRCGQASITLRSDGTITLRGRDITSWARRRQRIRGGSVAIN